MSGASFAERIFFALLIIVLVGVVGFFLVKWLTRGEASALDGEQTGEDKGDSRKASAPESGSEHGDATSRQISGEDIEDDDNEEGTMTTILGGSTVFEEMDIYDPCVVPRHIKETYTSWKLLATVMAVLAEFWIALGFMYWSLLYEEGELMDCHAPATAGTERTWVRLSCYYTLACLRGFPIMAANIVLVLTIRIIVQARLYYSMMHAYYVLDFADVPFLHTWWPWLLFISMVQGGLHFALKAHFERNIIAWDLYGRLVRKFVLPGTIFFQVAMRWVNIENTLIPFNRIIELDYTKTNKHSQWLARVQALNERVLAWDARHRDVIGETEATLGKPPTVDNIVRNMISNYDKVPDRQSRGQRWGMFKSMWIASVLLDPRLDRKDPETRSWLMVFAILVTGSGFTSILSFYMLFRCTETTKWDKIHVVISDIWSRGLKYADPGSILANTVILIHAIVIAVFIRHAIRNMFYHKIQTSSV